MTLLLFGIPFFVVFVLLYSYFSNWKDERPDLGGFGGKKNG